MKSPTPNLIPETSEIHLPATGKVAEIELGYYL